MSENEAPSRYPPSAVWSGVRMIVQAWIRSRPRDEGEAFLRSLAEVVGDEEMVFPLMPNRPRSERGEQRSVQREASDRIRTALPLLVAALPARKRK